MLTPSGAVAPMPSLKLIGIKGSVRESVSQSKDLRERYRSIGFRFLDRRQYDEIGNS